MKQPRINLCRHGFTLIELVLVMMLLCIFAAVTAPLFRGFATGRNAGNTARQIVALAQWGQTQSVTRSEVYRLNFDMSERTYWLTVRHGAVFDRLGEEFGRDFSIPSSMSIELDKVGQDGASYVEFEPTGRCDAVFVRLTSDSGSVLVMGSSTAADPFTLIPSDQSYTWGQHPSPIGGAHL